MTITASPTSTSPSTTTPTSATAPNQYRPRIIPDGVKWVLRTGPKPDPDEILSIIREHLATYLDLTLIPPSGRQCHFSRHPAYPASTKDPLGDQVRTVLDVLNPEIPRPLPAADGTVAPLYDGGARHV